MKMKTISIRNRFIAGLLALFCVTTAQAGAPLWTFTPLSDTSISIASNGMKTIQYRVTNQSAKSHSLVMTPITGITPTITGPVPCGTFTLPTRGSSCILSLLVNGSLLTHSITDGPDVCEQGSKLQCYRPSASDVLNISIGKNEYTIGGAVSGLSGAVVLQNNGADNETVSSDGGFTFSTAIAEGSPYAVAVFTQPTGQTCTVANGSGTVGAANVTNVAVNCVSNATTLSSSVSTLALSVNDTGLNTALTGKPRKITITNTGAVAATSVTYSPSPALPSGTTISPASCGTIAPAAPCVLTVTPGSTPSAAPGNISPTPITLSISGTNTNTLTPTLNILTYGSVYQSGYVYSVDDSTSEINSMGGKVAGLSNVSDSIQWAKFPGTDIPGAESNTNGIQNTNDIVNDSFCSSFSSDCAAFQCRNNFTAGGYTDWYLPAICEEGFDQTSRGSGCGIPPALPTIQNMQSNLVDNGDVGSLSGFYWSSTENSSAPTGSAWYQSFATGGGSNQPTGSKFLSLGVRCARALTI